MQQLWTEFCAQLPTIIQLAGWGQILLIIGSLGIPKVLGWQRKLAGLSTLIRQMFWVYSLYIWCTNLCFGLISAFGSHLLLDGSALAACVCGFIFGYWLLRMIIQRTYFDISELPQSWLNTAARWILEVLFIGLAIVYGGALIWNVQQLNGVGNAL